MKNKNQFLTFTTVAIALCLLCLLCLWLFTKDSIWEDWDFSEKGQIGDTIGGITSPIIGIVGFIVLYLSFRAQRKAIDLEYNWRKKQLFGESLVNSYKEIKEEYFLLSYREERGLAALYFIAEDIRDLVDKEKANAGTIDELLQVVYSLKNLYERLYSSKDRLFIEDRIFIKACLDSFYKFKLKKVLDIILINIDGASNEFPAVFLSIRESLNELRNRKLQEE